MIDAIPLLLAPEGYQISRSVRLRSSASAYFNRTPASASNRTTWTWSGWVKRGSLPGTYQIILQAGSNSQPYTLLSFQDNNTIQWDEIVLTNSVVARKLTTQVFRDPSAWYHLVFSWDTTNATAAERQRIYVNGQRIAAFSSNTEPSLNANSQLNNNSATYIGALLNNTLYLDGYLTEINFIDGQALTPSSFGETNPVTGVWQPKKYTGTYGTNGFYLNFSDNSNNTAATIGKDFSGNGNNWTPNNISVTAGATYDSMLDVPTQWADGGNGRGNYSTWNPTIAASTGLGTITNGNLQCVTPTSGASNNYNTIGMTSGKWYWEITPTSISTNNSIVMIGICNNIQSATEGYSQSGGYYYRGNGERWNNGTGASYGSALSVNDVIGVAFDADARTLEFYRNGTSMGTAYSSIPAGEFFSGICDTGTTVTWTAVANFGQRPFAYTPPTGFRALNTLNLPTPTILKGNQFFDATTYTGTGAARSVVNAGGFQPDFVWIKRRNISANHQLYDALRGVQKALYSDLTSQELTQTGGLTAFNSNGFAVGSDAGVNGNTDTQIAWQWKEGPTQGFDIVTYTGNGSANRTVSHSLGVTPAMVIVRNRTAAVQNWRVWHQSLGGNTSYLGLNQTAAVATSSTVFNGFSSTTFTVGTDPSTNENTSNFVAYLFSEVAGFSRFGSYTGNGSADGPFCFTGFLPRFVMTKRTDTTSAWIIWDTARDTINVAGAALFPHLSNAEIVATNLDILSNGFKMRNTGTDYNASGGTYIFAAFSSNPFKNSLAR